MDSNHFDNLTRARGTSRHLVRPPALTQEAAAPPVSFPCGCLSHLEAVEG
jgi:hypothetical protein